MRIEVDGYTVATSVLLGVVLFAVGIAYGRADSSAATVREIEAQPVPRALPDGVSKFHDATDGVTCWTSTHIGRAGREIGSMACMPDAWLASARDDAQAVQP